MGDKKEFHQLIKEFNSSPNVTSFPNRSFCNCESHSSAFSVFAWIKGGLPGQVILSQNNGVSWLAASPSDGYLMTGKGGGRGASELISDVVITDGNWHRIGFTWDGDYRILYVDDVIAVIDTQNALQSSNDFCTWQSRFR